MKRAVPTSTYRVHLTADFTLHDAAALVPHLASLGVDWLYCSPIQTVAAGASHGYHILRPDEVNPELGGEEGLAAVRSALDRHGMGMVLDIVPNHLAASPDNPWWYDLLARGPESPHAQTFDVDFEVGPLVLPVLGEQLPHAVEAGAIRIDGDELVVHDELRLPLRETTDVDAPLETVLAQQAYRLAEWRQGESELNWRRFFAISDLAGVRVEDPAVFDAVHAAVLRWMDGGFVDGLRIDHVDGLVDPGAYLTRLRQHIGTTPWLVVEKIVEQDEVLPPAWPADGTTGYEVGATIGAWLVDADGVQGLREAFASEVDLPVSAAAALPDSKLAQLDELFSGELSWIVRTAATLPDPPDPTVLGDGLRHLAAHLAGYRTYAPLEGPIAAPDRDAILRAADAAVAAGHATAAVAAETLLRDDARPVLLRWQQLTGPAAAKGFEDRLLFRQVAVSALCEVGADAHLLDRVPPVEAIHHRLAARAADEPIAGSTTSTHDTKRSEDVRARLAVLTEQPDLVTRLTATAPGPDAHVTWLVLQAVVGSLGLEVADVGADGEPSRAYRDRLQGWAAKAIREAEVATGHRDPAPAYEAAVSDWIDGLLRPGEALTAIMDVVSHIAVAGMCNSLATVLLKIAAPGVPDIYRGCEALDGSLTDPDNRRPLDVERLAQLRARVAEAGDPGALRATWRDGALKMAVTTAALHARAARPEVFLSTRCAGVTAVGPRAAHVAALRRDAAPDGPLGTDTPQPAILTVATRLPLTLAGGQPQQWPLGEVWGDTTITVGPNAADVTDLITGRRLSIHDGVLRMAEVTTSLPAAMLEIHENDN